MPAFFAADSYSSLGVLLAGVATFVGCLGTGRLLLKLLRQTIPPPWRTVVSLLLGFSC